MSGNGNRNWGTTAAATVAAVAVGAALLYSKSSSTPPNAPHTQQKTPQKNQNTNTAKAKDPQKKNQKPAEAGSSKQANSQQDNSTSQYLASLLQKMNTPSNLGGSGASSSGRGVPKSSIPDNPKIKNLNALLDDIHLRYIALNNEDFKLHYNVFKYVFDNIHKTMKEVDPYYNKYSSRVQFAGSHYDWLRIQKPDEFDVDIIIDLPLCIKSDPLKPNESDITLEPKNPGFVQLKMGVQFQKLYKRDGAEWLINKSAYEWMDDKNYLLNDKFADWFKSVMNKALNKFLANGIPLVYVEGVPYEIKKSSSVPAMTLFIENKSRGFKLDIDFVPALKFPEDRWPICGGYRNIPPGCKAKQGVWMVVPKPNKGGANNYDKQRSWRIAMHDQERGLMENSNNMKLTIKYMKKLRDAMCMKQIASYYIKTLFFWEAYERKDPSFWSTNNPADLFKIMVKKLHTALETGEIPYFWNKSNNLIGGVDRGLLKGFAKKLEKLMAILEQPSEYKQVARYLLTPEEFKEYNEKFLHI